MIPSTEAIIKDHMKAARSLRKKLRDPKAARAFLIKAGIAEECKSAPNGIRLAKRFR